jgi:hypothetical protein
MERTLDASYRGETLGVGTLNPTPAIASHAAAPTPRQNVTSSVSDEL